MSTTTNLTTLKINYLTQAQYDAALQNDEIEENELYFTPGENPTDVPTASTISKFDSTAHMNSTDMTAAEVTSFVSGLNTSNNTPVADYIVDQGLDGMWTYRKWNSGIAECWGYNTENRAMTNTYGNQYYAAAATLNLPSGLFTSVTSAIGCRGGVDEATGLIGVSITSTTTTALKFYVFNSTSLTQSTTISFHVHGRWK